MKSKSVPVQVFVTMTTIKDKKSAFRASEPDMHYVNIESIVEGGGTVIIREFTFLNKVQAKGHFDHLKNLFKIK